MNAVRVRRVLTALPALIALTVGVAACGAGGEEASGGRISVVASTDVWGSVVSAVGDEAVQVKSLVGAAGDPHSYQATAEDAADVQSARLLVYNGGGYDDFFAQLAPQAGDVPKVVAFDLSDRPATANEHVWYDLPTVARVADAIAARLGDADPAQRQAFTDNANAFKARLDDLGREIDRIGAEHAGERVVATEPVAEYLVERARLVDATPHEFSAAVENETDVPIAAQQQTIDLVSRKQVAAVVNNVQTVTPATEKVVDEAHRAGLPVVAVTETLPDGSTDYVAWMDGQVKALGGALNES